MSSEEPSITYSTIESQVDKYLYEYNLIALRDALQYVLSHFQIYFNFPLREVVFAYREHMTTGMLVTIVLKNGVGLKVKIMRDKEKDKITGVDVWYVTE
jgi:hypothetical protein